ncbi:peptidoglycan DD-metalloendopeptidase family protein [Pontibacter qinzhouensis]|uniref:Peptidoglycan DD-metalloendopeptidase family protein n=1 Tax=Pontibacter qinzhouensis TaxID=2603253 RepID=A0A5C8K443_9BACT|nr:peptidoglycan DD-metalloendopeptidase family protein [Pontibacter qinzhouensis]TXK44451.1 peptidoglycan DD-metalloendopeptidase family protein [Pontibacter qinzhouensis]
MLKRRIGFAILILSSLLIFFTTAQPFNFNTASEVEEETDGFSLVAEEEEGPAPIVFGIPTDSMKIVEGEVKRGENLSVILADYNISAVTIDKLSQKAKDIYNVRKINARQKYLVLHAKDAARTAQYFIFEPNKVEYIVYDLRGDLEVKKIKREMEVVEKAISGEISHSLYASILKAGGSAQLVNTFADIYAWRLDLNRIQPGDKFKLIYEEKVVNGTRIGVGKLKAAYFEHQGQPLYAIAFDQDNDSGYFDQNGKSLKKAFLREPLEYSRISSRYTMNRFHPVQKVNKPHLGTDFAARAGTPIRTVGDGVVVEAKFTRGNGNYVKIKHNGTYTTQYLHMSKFAKGIKAGVRVQQGQTIGYVGSTGLATGPHLCYRFWKNGKQVDGLKVQLPEAEPINKKHMPTFLTQKEIIVQQMEALNTTGNKPQELLAVKEGNKSGGA